MRYSLLLFLVVLGFFSLTFAQGSYEDCCLRYVTSVSQHRIKNVVSYRQQVLDGSCNIRAIVFKMKKGRVFCANPKDKWVKLLIERIDKLSRQG
ncbi:C-C motif chemokine 25 [Salminus brasiliensis]|uniref:C-C motif chemokine 25 n=1 Tax=Salminus brasiliensis TaxID=930266 RepID=UPI003B8399ED